MVTGGAGYIGSHMVKLLADQGYKVTVVDNLSSGFADAVIGGELITMDLADHASLDNLFSKNSFDAVAHFAASSSVAESMQNPREYYRNNVLCSLNLFDVMVKYGLKKLIFSSTAAIYGVPDYTPIDEHHQKAPINPYGESKWIIEKILSDYDRAYGLRSVSLRYFNAAGAHPDGTLGERHDPETHLIPLAIKVATDSKNELTVNGTDYPTPDGTCLRDYVHVNDICDAHVLALEYLLEDGDTRVYNLGNGSGFSVLEVTAVVEKVTGKPVKLVMGNRRAGDPAVLVADASQIKKDWNWSPQYSKLEDMVSHAFNWWLRNKAESEKTLNEV